MTVGLGRSKPDPTIAHHCRRHAVPARWQQIRVPCDLTVIMGVNIDPARRYKIATCIDFGGRCALKGPDGANLGNQPVFDGDIGLLCRRASAVNQLCIADDKIKHEKNLQVTIEPIVPDKIRFGKS